MSEKTPQQTLQDHVSRAKELNVSLQEYADVYDVDLMALSEKMIDASSASDFVKINLRGLNLNEPQTVCSINHPDGWTLNCHEWPPASWLRTLEPTE